MSDARRKDCRESGNRLLQHLDGVLNPTIGYPEEPTWGYAFTYLAAIVASNGKQSILASKALSLLSSQDKSRPDYPWEFVVFCIQTAKKISTDPTPLPIDGYKAKGTRMFNWFLLRNQNKRLCQRFTQIDTAKLWLASKLYQDSSGLILDEFRTRSLQYHAFCLFLLSQLIDSDPDNIWLRQWFIRGIDFSTKHILRDGTSLYLGRGQEQIFGYGSLICALEYCHAKVKRLDETVLNQVCEKVLGFQRQDGSYPLVLRRNEPEPVRASFQSDQPSGWYGYNTLYDYQPFLAFCLLKAGRSG